MEHTVEVCPAWAEHRRVLVDAIGGGDISRPALVRGGSEAWQAVTSFCEAVMQAKEEVKQMRECLLLTYTSAAARGDARCV